MAPFEHVLFTCSETFQVFLAQEHVLFTCFETLWSAKRPTLKFVVLQTALFFGDLGKGDRSVVDFQYFDEFKVISSQYLCHTDFAVSTVTQLVRKLSKTPRNFTRNLFTPFSQTLTDIKKKFCQWWSILNLDLKRLLDGNSFQTC